MNLFYRNQGAGSLVHNAMLQRLEIIIALLAVIAVLLGVIVERLN